LKRVLAGFLLPIEVNHEWDGRHGEEQPSSGRDIRDELVLSCRAHQVIVFLLVLGRQAQFASLCKELRRTKYPVLNQYSKEESEQQPEIRAAWLFNLLRANLTTD
jgi:hypothetical protein